jgi:predicted DNA-binding transcriptional regulator YafY
MSRGDGLARQLQLMKMLEHRAKSDALRTLVDGIDRRESVRFKYRKPGERAGEERVVDPYLLHVQSGALYLIGYCHHRRALRTFLLDRISEAARTGAVFAAQARFARSALLHGALGPWEGTPQRIQLRFSADVAGLAAERRVHPAQAMQWRSDGGLDVELRAPICPPLVTWLLGWGSQVHVISPAALADRVRRAHARAASVGVGATRRTAAPASARRRRI